MITQDTKAASIESPPRIFDGNAEEFRSNFNRASFAFAHRLAGHPLFELPRLIELTKLMRKGHNEFYYDAGDVEVGQRWDQMSPTNMSAEQLIDRIENAGAWIVIKRRIEIRPTPSCSTKAWPK